MKRLLSFAVLMLLSPSAYAGNSFSFEVGGHRIHIEAPSHCDSSSCVSISIPGIYQTLGRDRYRDNTPDAVAPAAPASPPPPPPPAPVPALAPAPVVQPVAARPAAPPACQPLPVAATPPPAPVAPPIKASHAETLIAVPRPAPEVVAPIASVSHETDDDLIDTPLGDWQTEGHTGLVRIERCGPALCGYVLDPASNAKGEAVLIDMKPNEASQKRASQWSGNIYSRDSGNTYYATIAMKGQNSLQVEACALGKFFCSGNRWSRIDVQPARLITYRQISSQPKS